MGQYMIFFLFLMSTPLGRKLSDGLWRVLKLGKSLHNKAMQNARVIIEQNKQLQKENGRLTEENNGLKKRIASIDENAITRFRDQKNAE